MRIFKIRLFARFARHERIADKSLSDALRRAARGLIDADLGGGIISSAWPEAAPQAIAAAIEDEAMEEVRHDEKDKT